MGTAWQTFVARAIEGAPDDPFVRLLKSRLASDYAVIRINLTQTAKGTVYVVMLSHLRQLSTMEVGHSPSFTRWSLANGVRMASREEEEKRWALLAAERFQSIADELGAAYANPILLSRLRALGPARTMAALAQENAKAAAPGREQVRAIRRVDGFLGGLAADVGGALRYSAEEVGEILDGALERFVSKRFPLKQPALWSTGSQSQTPEGRIHHGGTEARRHGGRENHRIFRTIPVRSLLTLKLRSSPTRRALSRR